MRNPAIEAFVKEINSFRLTCSFIPYGNTNIYAFQVEVVKIKATRLALVILRIFSLSSDRMRTEEVFRMKGEASLRSQDQVQSP